MADTVNEKYIISARSILLIPIILAGTIWANSAYAEENNIPPSNCLTTKGSTIISLNPLWISTILTPEKDEDPLDQATIASLLKLSDVFKIHQKDIIILPLPHQSTFMPRDVAKKNNFNVDFAKKYYTNALETLDKNSIKTLNILDSYSKYSNYFEFQRRADHHWTSEGAVMVAAELVKKFSSKDSIPEPKEFSEFLVGLKWKKSRYIAPVLKDITVSPCDVKDHYLTDKDFEFVNNVSNNVEADLFADESKSIALLGTSYSTSSSNTFPRAIEYFSKRPVLNLSADGGGMATALVKNYASILDDDTIDTVIWEVQQLGKQEILGASSLVQGRLLGNCKEGDLIFKSQNISGKYNEWIEVPSFLGSFNTFNLIGYPTAEIEMELSYLDGSRNKVHAFKGSTWVQSNSTKDDNYMWNFAVPTIEEKPGKFLALAGLRLRLSGVRSEVLEGDIDITVNSCLKI